MRAADEHLPAVHAKHPQPEVRLAGQFLGGEGPATTLGTERPGQVLGEGSGLDFARGAGYEDRLLVGIGVGRSTPARCGYTRPRRSCRAPCSGSGPSRCGRSRAGRGCGVGRHGAGVLGRSPAGPTGGVLWRHGASVVGGCGGRPGRGGGCALKIRPGRRASAARLARPAPRAARSPPRRRRTGTPVCPPSPCRRPRRTRRR
jgi:hypothetical protein